MLSEEQQLLLTAFLDGVVTLEERNSVECLLRNSSEARAALRTMQENAHRLKKLSKTHLGQRFTSQVLASLPIPPNGAPKPVPTAAPMPAPVAAPMPEPIPVTIPADDDEPLVRKPRLRRGMPGWVVGSIAAGVILCAIGVASWLVPQPGAIDGSLLPTQPVASTSPRVKPKPIETQPTAGPMDPMIASVFMGASQRYAEPLTETPKPPPPTPPQPTKLAFGDLKHTHSFNYLAYELKKQESVRVDVNVKYNERSLNRLIEAFHKNGIHLTVSPPAHASLKKNQPVLVYAENVVPDKLALALRELAHDDMQTNNPRPTTYDRLQMIGSNAKDAVEVARGLGVAVDQIKQRPPRPASPEHTEGIVFSQESPIIVPREVHEFLSGRQEALPGTIQIYVQLVPKS